MASEAEDEQYPAEQDERVVRIEMMRADTELNRKQTQTKTWKAGAAVGGMVVGAFGAGAGFLGALILFLGWLNGAP